MKLSSTIIFVPLTAALPAIPSAIYTNDQLTAITAYPTAQATKTNPTQTTLKGPAYRPTETPAANVARELPDTAAIEAEVPDRSQADGQMTERDDISTAGKEAVAAVADGTTPNAPYPGAVEIETREAEKLTRDVPVVKLPVGKRFVRFLEKRVKTNSFCPKVRFN